MNVQHLSPAVLGRIAFVGYLVGHHEKCPCNDCDTATKAREALLQTIQKGRS